MNSKRKSPEGPWFKEGLHFECNQCGICCRGKPGAVWVNENERIMIAGYLKMPVNKFSKNFLRRIFKRYSLVESDNCNCVMYENGCKIYPVRPYQCRSFPFWLTNLESKLEWESLKGFCPGINSGKLYSCKEITVIIYGREY